MTEKQREKEMDALKMDIASLRDDIAALAASLRRLAEGATKKVASEGEQGTPKGEGSDSGEWWHNGWTDFQRKLEEARSGGEKAIKDLVVEIERHPLGSIAAAFSIGFIIAKLLDSGNKE
jgi:hypothetical protein